MRPRVNWPARSRSKRRWGAQLAEAQRKLKDALELVPKQMMAAQQLDIRRDRVEGLKAQIAGIESKQESLKAEVAEASHNLDHASILAPADGYLVDLMLRPGAFIRLKQPGAADDRDPVREPAELCLQPVLSGSDPAGAS
jgi:multidrug resistance efflux pump